VTAPDAIVVGSGPNGLAAAVTLARAGLAVEVLEGATIAGGGCRTEELTLPGFRHDVCSAVHPLLVASPYFGKKDGPARSVTLRFPEVAVAHPLDGTRAGAVTGTVAETAAGLGRAAAAYRRLMGPLVDASDAIVETVLAPPLRSIPKRPVAAARFALLGMLPARALARMLPSDEAQALVGGVAAHSMLPLTAALSGAFGLLLTTLAHSAGWPVVEGGSSGIVDALTGELERLGGSVRTGRWVRSLDDLPPARAVLLDVTPHQLVAMAGARLRGISRWQMERFRYGPGVFKVDWALSGPVPWTADACRRAATVHVGGTLDEVSASEADVAAGRHPPQPFCLVVQPGVVDPTRAPEGSHTLWAYCHTPAGSDVDMTARIEAQIERFAPGFRDLVLARATSSAAGEEARNPNYVGGDISSGAATLVQTLFRPTFRWNPYRTGMDGVYLCGASTPPGAGVHGMCGYWAAVTAIHDLGLAAPSL
jgi:phytoene dehydrogenase-like protein